MSIPPILYTLLKTWEKSREATWRKRWWSNNKYVRHFQNFKTCDLWSIWSKAQNLLDQGDISKCTWLLQPALEIALQYNFYYMDDIPHISFQSGFFSENFSVKLQEEKERENICYYTCDVFQHVKNQLELMTWNWIIPSIPIACAKILLIVNMCKKSRESSEWFQQTQAVHLVFWRVFWINYKRTLYDCKTQV